MTAKYSAKKSDTRPAAEVRVEMRVEHAMAILRAHLDHGGYAPEETVEVVVRDVCARYEDMIAHMMRIGGER